MRLDAQAAAVRLPPIRNVEITRQDDLQRLKQIASDADAENEGASSFVSSVACVRACVSVSVPPQRGACELTGKPLFFSKLGNLSCCLLWQVSHDYTFFPCYALHMII